MPDLDFVKVVGRLGLTVADAADADSDPEMLWCDSGEVWFTPLVTVTKVASADPVPATFGQGVFRVPVDSNGYLTLSGNPFVYLVDLTSDKVNPTIGPDKATHKVEFKNLRAAGNAVQFESFNARFAPDTIGPNGACDITLVAPVSKSGATPIVRGETGPGVQSMRTFDGDLYYTVDGYPEANAGPLPLGPDRFLIEENGVYPDRFDSDPHVFVGELDPDALGLMVIGDTWITKPGTSHDIPPYVTPEDLSNPESDAGSRLLASTEAALDVANPPRQVLTPNGFSWTDHPLVGKLTRDRHGVYTSTFDPAVGTTYKAPAGVTYYVDPIAGNDGNAGTSSGAPLKSIYVAVAKADVGTISLVAGIYVRQRGFNGTAVNKPINIICPAGTAIVTTHDALTWTKTAGRTSVYQANRSAVVNVVDRPTVGDGTKLANVASVALVDSTPGSWYTDGTVVYVHTSNSRAADSNVWALLNVRNFENVGDHTSYLENVQLWGGIEVARIDGVTATGCRLVMKGCEVHLSASGNNNLSVKGGDSYLVNTRCTRAARDGLNYHAFNGRTCKSIEVGVTSTDCGSSGGDGDQNSTTHDGSTIIRVNGTYTHAPDNIVDVSDGTQTWMMGCLMEGATGGQPGGNLVIGDSGSTNTEAWVADCTFGDADVEVHAYPGAKIHMRDSAPASLSGAVVEF